jgi:hypothetical protein
LAQAGIILHCFGYCTGLPVFIQLYLSSHFLSGVIMIFPSNHFKCHSPSN